MGPELFDSELGDSRRTKSSDCYALGMAVYEVLTGRLPFAQYRKFVIPLVVLRGERPERPQGPEGNWFTDDIWEILKRCWEHEPGNRPSVDCVLQSLEGASGSWVPLHPQAAEGLQVANFSTWSLSDSGGERSWTVVPQVR